MASSCYAIERRLSIRLFRLSDLNLAYLSSTHNGQVAIFNVTTGMATVQPIQLSTTSNELPQRRPRSNLATNLDVSFGDREVFDWPDDAGICLWFFNPSFVPDVILDFDCESRH